LDASQINKFGGFWSEAVNGHFCRGEADEEDSEIKNNQEKITNVE
jgi:hypothetical protein